jgi:hypothetical protein
VEEKTVKSIPLAKDLTLELLDLTKEISADACRVSMLARLVIPVKASLFSEETLKKIPLETILNKIGPTTTFEHRKERNFIMAEDKNKVFSHLVDTFMETLMPYVSKPSFPEKYILKCYRDKR